MKQKNNDVLVKCDHCGRTLSINEAERIDWPDYNIYWFYCKRCWNGLQPKTNNNK